jgi:hypothetical protein
MLARKIWIRTPKCVWDYNDWLLVDLSRTKGRIRSRERKERAAVVGTISDKIQVSRLPLGFSVKTHLVAETFYNCSYQNSDKLEILQNAGCCIMMYS